MDREKIDIEEIDTINAIDKLITLGAEREQSNRVPLRKMKPVKVIWMLIADCISVLCILFVVHEFWLNYFSWKELGFTYVGDASFSYPVTYVEENIKGTEPPGYGLLKPFGGNWNIGVNFWFYEVRSEQEWEWFCSAIGINDINTVFDFNNYYVFSFNRPLTYLQYNDCWEYEQFGCHTRANFDMSCYEEGKIYIYRLNKNIFFRFNIDDYSYSRYNLNKRIFFIDNVLGDDDNKPSWYDYYGL